MKLPTLKRRLVRHFIGGVVLLVMCATSCGVPTDRQAETPFRDLFNSTLTSELILVTDKQAYHHDEVITYWLQNRTGETLWFHDHSLDVQAFAYDEETGKWLAVDLGFSIADPVPTGIHPGAPDILHLGALLVEFLDVPEDGRIRLVITGHTDLENPVLDRIYTAYTDIEVVQ